MLQCLYLDKCLLPQHNTKKLLGTKSNCEHVQLGHIMNNKTQKDQTPVTAESCAGSLTQHNEGSGQTPTARPSDPTPGPTPALTTARNQLTLTPTPALGSKQGKLLLHFFLSCCSTSPSKVFLEFLVWPVINFHCLRRPRTLFPNTTRILL